MNGVIRTFPQASWRGQAQFFLFICYGVKLRLSDALNVGPRGLRFAKYLRYVHVFCFFNLWNFGMCSVRNQTW